MFTGLVEEVGKVVSVSESDAGRRFRIAAKLVLENLKLGASVAVSGACLTVVSIGADWFEVECTLQTLRATRLGAFKPASLVNLERALQLSGRLDGHLVAGHVDGVARVVSVRTEGFARLVTFSVASCLSCFFVEKGSVAVDGVSLTIASMEQLQVPNAPSFSFTVALIPHTMNITTVGDLKVGDEVNIESDLIGKYLLRLLEPAVSHNVNKAPLTAAFLAEHGYA